MDSQNLYQIVLDQQEELASYQDEALVVRKEAGLLDFDSRLAQVVIGVRRSGKSTLCHMALQSHNIHYGYVNFDDDRLARASVDDLNLLLEALYRVYGVDVKYLMFDEVQNVDGWHLFVNRLLRQGIHIVVTGSNAKLLSSELATHLTGRYHEIRLYPFSFRDFCSARHIPIAPPTTKNVSLQQNALQEYLLEGGFPELYELSNRRDYVEGVIHTIINKDIKARFHLRNANGLNTLAQHLMNHVGQVINVADLTTNLGIGSNKTVRSYVDYLCQAFLIIPLHRFSYKSRERLINEKAYLIDTGVLSYHGQGPTSDNMGWRLENVVMMELLRRTNPNYQEVFYYRPTSQDREVDFVITDQGRVVQLIQVSLDISKPKTFGREVKALVEAANKLGCDDLTLIALSQTRDEVVAEHTVKIVSAHEWLLSE